MLGVVAWVIAGSNTDIAHRTLRALGDIAHASIIAEAELAAALTSATAQVLIAQAGAWFPKAPAFPALPDEGEWLAAGANIGCTAWRRALVQTGGDLNALRWWNTLPPAPPVLLLSPAAARKMGGLLARGFDFAWRKMLRGSRAVHLQELDAALSDNLRVLQLITTIQIGGAERVAVDLASELPRHGVAVMLATTGRPSRETLPQPANFVDFSSADDRVAAAHHAALAFGADVIHTHLLRGGEIAALRSRGIPLVASIHNMPPGWAPGFGELRAGDCDMLLACARAVEREAAAALPGIPVRTVWNGIVPHPAPARKTGGPFTVLTLANPRAQKRLELIPRIAKELAAMLAPRPVRFIVAGSLTANSDDSHAALTAFGEAVAGSEMASAIERAGLVRDVPALLAQSDVLLSTSAYEGLSIAHLEAVAAGVPVVATATGGTPELAGQTPLVTLVSADCNARGFAAALHQNGEKMTAAPLPPSFTRHEMARRTAHFYLRAIRRASLRPQPAGLWLVTNNFSTGGAQTSARRLLGALKARGLRVRAAVVQEQPSFLTPGRAALEGGGIPVLAASSQRELLDAIERDPAEAVFFWNLITSWKVFLADSLLGARIFDVSPGEMFFPALEKFFAAPPPGLPYRSAREYGGLLAGAVVKYADERAVAAAALGCPVHVIRNGVPHFPKRRPRAGQRLIIGTAARLSPDKKLEQFLDAIRLAVPELPEFEIRIAGGPERDHPGHARVLRERADGLPVRWDGPLTDIAPFLAELDIFIAISEPGGCPNATLEAMSAGIPVIATNHGAAAEQVEKAGILCARGDTAGIARELAALARDSARRAALSAAGRDFVAREFSMDAMAEGYAKLIRR